MLDKMARSAIKFHKRQGDSNLEIAQKFGHHRNTVSCVLKQPVDLEPKPRHKTSAAAIKKEKLMTNHDPNCTCDLCYDDRLKQMLVKAHKTISQGEPYIMSVGASESIPPFAYTIGFNILYDLPDVIIFGLSLKYMYGMLMDISDQAKEGLIKMHNGYEHKSRGTEFKQVLGGVVEREAILDYFGKVLSKLRPQPYFLNLIPPRTQKSRCLEELIGKQQ